MITRVRGPIASASRSGVLYAYGRQLLRNVIYLRVGRLKRARHS